MTFDDNYTNEISARRAYWEFQFQCATFPFILQVPRTVNPDCCFYLQELAEAKPTPYLRFLRDYCGHLPEPPPPPEPPVGIPEITLPEFPEPVLVKPPKRVIPDPEKDIPDDENPPPNDFIPVLPPRILPNQNQTDSTFSSRVCETLSTRKFGCLLHDPFVTTGFSYCVYGEEPETFWEDLLERSRQLGEQIFDFVVEEAVEKVCDLAILRLPLPWFHKAVLIFGCRQIDDIAKHLSDRNKNITNFPKGGYIFLGQTEVTQCPEVPAEDTEAVEDDFVCDNQLDECFVPLRFFSKDNEEYHGRKRQLQIVFRQENYSAENNKSKRLTIPAPRLDVTVEEIKQYIPQWLYFGHTRYEATVEPYGYLRYYGKKDSQDLIPDDVEAWFIDIAQNLAIQDGDIQGEIETDSFRYSEKTRIYAVGWYYPYKAYLLDFADDTTTWICKSQNFIYRSQPTETPPTLTNLTWRQLP